MPQLRPNSAYSSSFNELSGDPGPIQGLGIVAGDIKSAAATLKMVDRVLGYPYVRVDNAKEIRTSVRVGQETRLFRGAEPDCTPCEGFSYQSYSVAWRSGQVIGLVVVTRTKVGTPDLQEAFQLARRQLSHLKRESG